MLEKDENQPFIEAAGGEQELMRKPMSKQYIICEIEFKKKGFQLKFGEDIHDNITLEKKHAENVMSLHLYPNLKSEIT